MFHLSTHAWIKITIVVVTYVLILSYIMENVNQCPLSIG